MTAKIKPYNDIMIITLGGTLDIEYTQTFKMVCLKEFQSKKVIFNMQNASFVGSTGIQPFMETLVTLSMHSPQGIKIVGAGVEFRRIFQNLEIGNLEICDNEDAAIGSYLKSSLTP